MTDPMPAIDTALASIVASDPLRSLLRELHHAALTEPAYVSTDSQPASAALDRFVALEPEKCALVYLLLRASGARNVVEAGTSFGLSTIYLALAVDQNARAHPSGGSNDGSAKIIATENEASKALRAREHWRRAGPDIERRIELREGDLRETLKSGLPDQVDFVLLDIWSVLALPVVQLVKPRLRRGALLVADNWIASGEGYHDLLAYISDPKNGFRSTTLPYGGGLQAIVYVGTDDES